MLIRPARSEIGLARCPSRCSVLVRLHSRRPWDSSNTHLRCPAQHGYFEQQSLPDEHLRPIGNYDEQPAIHPSRRTKAFHSEAGCHTRPGIHRFKTRHRWGLVIGRALPRPQEFAHMFFEILPYRTRFAITWVNTANECAAA